MSDGQLTMYDNVVAKTEQSGFGPDLCRGPHLPTTRRHSGLQADAHRSGVLAWQIEKNQQLQRIYGTAWESKRRI